MDQVLGDSSKGANTKWFIESGDGITPTIVIAELSEKYGRGDLLQRGSRFHNLAVVSYIEADLR